jgi:hypothetical protein
MVPENAVGTALVLSGLVRTTHPTDYNSITKNSSKHQYNILQRTLSFYVRDKNKYYTGLLQALIYNSGFLQIFVGRIQCTISCGLFL